MSGHQGKSAQVFNRLGLHQTGKWQSFATPEERDGPRASARLRDALEELGGVYGAYARFLGWRADVMDAESLQDFRHLSHHPPPLPAERVKALAHRELGRRSNELVRHLQPKPVWSSFSRTAWRSTWNSIPVVVQMAADVPPAFELDDFEKSMQFLNHPDLAKVNSPELLAEFRVWLSHGESSEQERRYLLALRAQQGRTLVDYPQLIDEVSTPNILVWPWLEGESAAEAIARGSVHAIRQIAIAVLEQFCSLAIVDAELDLNSLVITRDYRLAVRRLNRPVAVPPSMLNLGIKYLASVLAGESTLVVQSLVPLAAGVTSADREKRMMNALSSVEPELKIHMWYPASAAAFESNWKALNRLQLERPLFLNILHRNLVATGYWNADVVMAGAAREDAIVEAQGPVVNGLLREQVPGLLNPKVMSEWAVGSGLFLFGALRASTRIAEELRDNNLTLGVEVTDPPAERKKAGGSARYGAGIAVLLGVMLLALRYGSRPGASASPLLGFVVVSAALGLFWIVNKLS